MYYSCKQRITLALVLGAILIGPWAAVAEVRVKAEPGLAPRSAALSLDFMTRLWHLLDRVLTKTGCSIDPNGACKTGQSGAPTVPGETGCSLDPNGECRK